MRVRARACVYTAINQHDLKRLGSLDGGGSSGEGLTRRRMPGKRVAGKCASFKRRRTKGRRGTIDMLVCVRLFVKKKKKEKNYRFSVPRFYELFAIACSLSDRVLRRYCRVYKVDTEKIL